MENVCDIGEQELIRRLTAKLPGHPLLRTGVGDDCAVTEVPGTGTDQVFTTDPVIEGVHFKSSDDPARIGHKAAGRVLSDIAAMGAQPQWLLVNVVARPEQDARVLEGIYSGMNTLCHRFGATLIGGDVARGHSLELHVFGTGTVPTGTALLRSGAAPDDQIFVTGALGGSIQGRHLDFIPCVAEGLFLRESGCVTSMMDISDGLATDLRHILKCSGVGALLDAERIPINGTLDQALYDGEDFELLFTVRPDQTDVLMAAWSEHFDATLHPIGKITDEKHILRLKQEGHTPVLNARAFEHFSTSAPESGDM
jgi:thiamine-monophosphate kinase